MEQIKGKHFREDAKAVRKRPNPGGSDMNHEGRLGTISSTMSSMMTPQRPLQTAPCVPLEVPGIFFYPIQISASKERSERAGTSSSNPLLNMEPEIPQPSDINEESTNSDSRSSSPFSAVSVSTDTSEDFQSDQNERSFFNESPPSIRRRSDPHQRDETTQDEITQRLQQRLPSVMEQIKGKNYCEGAKVKQKRPNPGGSDTNQERKVGTISSTISSVMEPEAPFETLPCVPEEFPDFSSNPIQISASIEGAERAGTSLSKLLLNTEPEIPQPSNIDEESTNSDSRSSSPFSTVTVSTDTSEDFQSDQNERSSNESSPSIRRRSDQHQQDETTQDEITQGLQQHLPIVMEQINGNIYREDANAARKRRNPGGSDRNHGRTFGTISFTMSSFVEPEDPLETSPCVPLEFPNFISNPIQILASMEGAERAGTSSSKPLLNMEPEIPQPSYINEESTNSDSRSSSPFSAVTVSTDTSEDFQSDQNEISFNESPASIRKRSDEHLRDEITQDEITQRLQQRVREMNELVEHMRAKKLKM